MQKTSFVLGDTEMHLGPCSRGPARRGACKSGRTGDCVHQNIFTWPSACRCALSVPRCVHSYNGIGVLYEYFRSMAESHLCVGEPTSMKESLDKKNLSAAEQKLRVGNLSHLMRRVHGKSHLSRAVHIWMTESSERDIFSRLRKSWRAALIQ